MEEKDQEKKRPVSRKKKVVEGTVQAGRREDGAVNKPKEGKEDERLDLNDVANIAGALSGSGSGHSGSGAQSGSSLLGGLLGGLGSGSGHSGSGSSSGKRPSLITVIILAAVVLLGGGGGLGALLGGLGNNGADPLQSVVSSVTQGVTGAVSSAQSNVGKLDTTVSKDARDKRVVLAGDGSDTTTVMVYMCGTDLESSGGFATRDLQEMMAADLGDKLDLVVFTGGCKSWKTPQISTKKNQIFQVEGGKLSKPLWESNSLQSMTDPATLSGFIKWTVKNRPADRYALIFWDHGGGSLSGYGYDEMNKSSGSMDLAGIAKALKDGGCTFDFIGFDACLMATLETALVVEPYADYLIASEETEPGCGWYYTPWLNALAQEPSMSALNIGKNIADSFVSGCAQVARGQQATLSVIDLAELAGTVPDKFQDFALATTQSIRKKDYKGVAAARSSTKEFAQRNGLDQVDLIHLADNMATAQSKALAEVLRSAVKYNATSTNISNANGVSIYFPYGKTSGVNAASKLYGQIGLDSAYTDCIKSFASLEVAGQAASGGSAAQLGSLFGALTGSGGGSSASGDMVGQLLGALLQGRDLNNVGLDKSQAGFLDVELVREYADYLAENRLDPADFVWTDKAGEKVLMLSEEQWALIRDVELNVFLDDGDGYVDLGLDNTFELDADGNLLGGYDGTWITVNGNLAAIYMLETDPATGTTYSRIPAMLNGQPVDLMVAFGPDDDGQVLGAAPRYDPATETATVARGLFDLQKGDILEFVCGFYDYDRTYQEDYYLKGTGLVVDDEPLALANMRLDTDATVAAYRITDIYNNHYWTQAM